jgi:hypothetical protein
MIFCACGCGELRPLYDKQRNIRKYINGHQRRLKANEFICNVCGKSFRSSNPNPQYCSIECNISTKRKAIHHDLQLHSEKDYERFFSKIYYAPSGCMEWTGGLSIAGYGIFYLDSGTRIMRAHRVAYETWNEHAPKGKVIHHICENPKCVNPNHLQALTYEEHILVSTKCPIYKNAIKTHCIHGHLLTPDNICLHKVNGKIVGRICRECYRMGKKRLGYKPTYEQKKKYNDTFRNKNKKGSL